VQIGMKMNPQTNLAPTREQLRAVRLDTLRVFVLTESESPPFVVPYPRPLLLPPRPSGPPQRAPRLRPSRRLRPRPNIPVPAQGRRAAANRPQLRNLFPLRAR
jgi:hypothetical protein